MPTVEIERVDAFGKSQGELLIFQDAPVPAEGQTIRIDATDYFVLSVQLAYTVGALMSRATVKVRLPGNAGVPCRIR